MPARRRSRQRALQVLFEWDLRRSSTSPLSVDQAIANYYESLYSGEDDADAEPLTPPDDPFMAVLVRGAIANLDVIDALITQRSQHWRLVRMPAVDRNILRMAVYEMKEQGTPPAVVIDEALELARRYSDEEAVPFLNGVLDGVRRIILPELLANTEG